MAETTPITLLTGPNRPDKSTLLNHLLRHPGFARTAVLLGEPGQTAIDHPLVRTFSSPARPLAFGCPCCTGGGDLVRILRAMLPAVRRGEINRVLIETAGPADPLPILATLIGDSVLATIYHVSNVVTVIDTEHGLSDIDRYWTTARQVAIADSIVIGKSDPATAARLRALNPAARIIEAAPGTVDPACIPNTGASRFQAFLQHHH